MLKGMPPNPAPGAQTPDETQPPPKPRSSWLPGALATGAGLGVGLGTYALMRRPAAAGSLGAIRQQAAHGFHRVVDVTPDGRKPLTAANLWKVLKRGVKDPSSLGELSARLNASATSQHTGGMSLLDRFFLRAVHGHSAIPVMHHPEHGTVRVTPTGFTKEPLNVAGVVQDRTQMVGTPQVTQNLRRFTAEGLVRGGTNLEGSPAVLRNLDRPADGGKRREAEPLLRADPEAIPRTVLDIPTMRGTDRVARARALHAHLKKQFGAKAEFVLKPNIGLQSNGEFPHSGDNWGTLLKRHDAHFANPKNVAAFEALDDTGRTWYLRDRNLYGGRALHQALEDPTSVLAQQWLPGHRGEYRVHVLGGAPTAATPRHEPGGLLDTTGHEQGAKDFAARLVSKLGPEYQSGAYGFDVGIFDNPADPKQPLYKLMEMNPAERPRGSNPGGQSGLMDPAYVPWAPREMTEHVTGRRDPLRVLPAAAGLGSAAALGAYGLGGLLTKRRPPAPNGPTDDETA